jgi:hypothetical protein
MITGASRNPLAAFRSPVVPLNENTCPGLIRVWSMRLATNWTLCTRFASPV